MHATKKKLIRAAIRLFAQNDINSVAVATINDAADVHNKSAIYYHFKSKWGLADAAIHHVLTPYVEQTMLLLNQIDSENANIEAVVDALMKPMIQIIIQKDGYYAVKFFSRMISAGDEGRQLVTNILLPITLKTQKLLQSSFPEAHENALSMKILFSFNAIINIMSDAGLEKFWPTKVHDHKKIALYIRDFIIGGMLYKNEVNY